LRAKAELGETSDPRFVKVQDQQNQVAASNIGQPVEVVRNWMYANSIHTIDYLRVFGRGRITSVEPVLRWDPERPGVVVCRIVYDSCDVGLYEGIWRGPGPWAVTVTTAEKRCEMRPLEKLTLQEFGKTPQHVDPDALDTDFKPGFRRQAEAAIRAACGTSSEVATLADAVETMRLVARIFA
jgi:hypothetical protein